MENEQMAHKYTLDATELPSEGIYTAVSTLKNCSPLDIPPLARTIDPDGLDVLLADESGTAEVSFSFCGYEVVATPGEIRVASALVE